MNWIYLVIVIVMIPLGLWGLVARAKWLEEQSKKIKNENLFKKMITETTGCLPLRRRSSLFS
ncbi:hypothetical protein E1I69_21175 [Bacillus timonensis]|uniref:Uncharacterized protein n=1 Tax=Bacillus timonensis TaxID=1033734 RepID=A0A4S3PJZ7_9BACI|nr:hypothetical protein [Bacillus timonensis]THE09757.1 hypothetical protein E1I69_21175 [Bacillus timonensis]